MRDIRKHEASQLSMIIYTTDKLYKNRYTNSISDWKKKFKFTEEQWRFFQDDLANEYCYSDSPDINL